MSSPPSSPQPGRLWFAETWPILLLTALLAGLNLAAPALAEWYRQPGGDHMIVAVTALLGVCGGQFCLVFLLAGLARRTALGGIVLGLAIALALCAAMLAGFWFTEQMSAPDYWTPYCLLPPIVLCGAAPLVALRQLFYWRLWPRSAAADPPAPLLLGDLFAAIALTAAVAVVARVPLVVNELRDSAEFWTGLGVSCAVAFGAGLLIAPWCGWLALGARRRWAGWLGLAGLAVAIAVLLLLVAQAFVGPPVTLRQRLEPLKVIAVAVASAAGVLYGSLAVLAACGIAIRRSKPMAKFASAVPAAHGFDARRLFSQRWQSRAVIVLALLVAIVCSIGMARLQSWRHKRDAEIDRLVRSANRLDGVIFHNGRTEMDLKLGPPATNDDLLLFRDCRELRTLDLDMPNLTDAGLAHLALFPRVSWLHLRAARVSDGGMQHVGGLKHLEYLEIRNTPITDDGLHSLAGLTELIELTLIDTHIRGAGLAHFPPDNKIVNLTLEGLSVDNSACQVLAQWDNLNELSLRRAQISDLGLRELSAAASLATLDLRETDIDGSGLQGFVALRNLYLDGSAIDDEALVGLQDSHQLLVLSLNQTAVTDAGLKQIAAIANLWELHLSHTAITDEGLMQLRDHGNLRVLDVSGTCVTGEAFQTWSATSGLRTLILDESAIDDARAAHLVGMPPLERLSLACTNVSDACLPHLAKMQIGTLDLSDTQVTADGLVKHGTGTGKVLIVSPGQFTPAEIAQLQQAAAHVEVKHSTADE